VNSALPKRVENFPIAPVQPFISDSHPLHSHGDQFIFNFFFADFQVTLHQRTNLICLFIIVNQKTFQKLGVSLLVELFLPSLDLGSLGYKQLHELLKEFFFGEAGVGFFQ
jgi:hypothetical protein